MSRPDPAAAGADSGARGGVRKGALLASIVIPVVALDIVTKEWVVRTIGMYERRPVLGDWFRLTYTHNPGAAFGIHVGEHSRIFFLVLALLALVVLGLIYRSTPRRDPLRLAAVALVAGGAVGNILDRIRYRAGVVDFLDVGIGDVRWPTFNVADSAVSVGAVLLLISFWLEERRTGGEPDGSPDP
ncbi:MAG: signal peptidase II [Gemmatimonadota bacterium]|nr:signal peptidase II [Gemmatimonadota bacterium]